MQISSRLAESIWASSSVPHLRRTIFYRYNGLRHIIRFNNGTQRHY
jgi:hypothetical protein